MYEGKPLVLMIGGSDTGRTPIAGALLRRALGASAVVRTAGVLSHEGEPAMTEAQMAMEQFGIDISRHVSHPLNSDDQRDADLFLAVDRGTELVLHARFPNDPRVMCLPALADLPDVLDPHRMPLGVWIAAMRQLEEQINKALPAIRRQLNISDHQPPLSGASEAQLPPAAPAFDMSRKLRWDRDEDMQRLMGLINGEIAGENNGSTSEQAEALHEKSALDVGSEADIDDSAASPVAPNWQPEADQQSDLGWNDEPSPTVARQNYQVEAASATEVGEAQPPVDRGAHVAHMLKLIDAAIEVPEIIDWLRLRQALVARLRTVAGQAQGAIDFVAAATLMIEGKLAQCAALPHAQALALLRSSMERLGEPVDANGLGAVGTDLGQW